MHGRLKWESHLTGIRHVVWDWNGTLLDDTWLCIEIANQMLSERGISTMSKRRYQQIFDFPVILYYQRMGFDFKKESFEELGAQFIKRYEVRRNECRLHKCAYTALNALHLAGITQSILSNYPHHTLEEVLRHHNVRDFFDDVTGADDVYARGKTERGRQWLVRSTYRLDEVVLVGDTLHDHEVARELGIRSALVTIGSHSRSRLAPTGAPTFDSLSRFLSAVLKPARTSLKKNRPRRASRS